MRDVLEYHRNALGRFVRAADKTWLSIAPELKLVVAFGRVDVSENRLGLAVVGARRQLRFDPNTALAGELAFSGRALRLLFFFLALRFLLAAGNDCLRCKGVDSIQKPIIQPQFYVVGKLEVRPIEIIKMGVLADVVELDGRGISPPESGWTFKGAEL